jgi:tetratricopeptide (TPR) repeat protein
MKIVSNVLLAFLISLPFSSRGIWADDDKTDSLNKAAAIDAGKMGPNEKKLFEQSIRTTKQSIAQDTLDMFYRDALDFYHEKNYDASLDLLDRIYSANPDYQDVRTLRATVQRIKANKENVSTRYLAEDYMRKGNDAMASGQTVAAISFWKQALDVNPRYTPAKKKIDQANHALAEKQFQDGYSEYRSGSYQEALESWSNAIALDPSYKDRGLLPLMSKLELELRKNKIQQLAAQGQQQYAAKEYEAALGTYQTLVQQEPRNTEAQRMASKLKIVLGQRALRRAEESQSAGRYAEAAKQWQSAIDYNYEVARARRGITEAEASAKKQEQAKRAPKKTPKKAPEASTPPPAGQAPPPANPPRPSTPPPSASKEPANPEEAMNHYRQGLMAIRSNDLKRALEELEIAAQLDPTNERIYMAKERTKAQWNAANTRSGQ